MKAPLPDYIEVLDTRDKNNDLKTIKYRNRFIHSPYDPGKEAETIIEKYPGLKQVKVIILFGLGMGYILRALSNVIKNSDIKIIAIEYEEHFKNFYDEKPGDNILLCFGKPADSVWKILAPVFIQFSLRDVLFLEVPGIMQINEEYYRDIKERIKIYCEQKVADLTTTAYFSSGWLFNSFINFRHISPFLFINELKSAFAGQKGLLVSSGPSVEKDISYIRRFKGIIISLPPSVNYLLKNGLIPDFILLGDSSYYNQLHLRKAMRSGIPLLADLSVHYTLLKRWEGPRIIFSYNLSGLEFFFNKYKIGHIPQGGTAASTALYVLKYFGISDVTLSGQDFAYQDLKLHLKGSGYEVYRARRINKFKTLFDLNYASIKGNKLEYTEGKIIDHKLKLYKDWFIKLVRILKINIADKEEWPESSKKKIRLKSVKRIQLGKELAGLKEELKKEQSQKCSALLERIKGQRDIYNLIRGFAFQEFLKVEQGVTGQKEELCAEIFSKIEKLQWLIDFNLRK